MSRIRVAPINDAKTRVDKSWLNLLTRDYPTPDALRSCQGEYSVGDDNRSGQERLADSSTHLLAASIPTSRDFVSQLAESETTYKDSGTTLLQAPEFVEKWISREASRILQLQFQDFVSNAMRSPQFVIDHHCCRAPAHDNHYPKIPI
jgi:hypothetical protein